MTQYTRRRILVRGGQAIIATGIGCNRSDAKWCNTPQLTEDGPFSTATECLSTASNIEGPYYLKEAPTRTNLDIFGDDGTPFSFEGRVFDGTCEVGLNGATIEFWHADPDGKYDNNSDDMKYRCSVTTDANGAYSLKTLLPGLYKNGLHYRPRHIHVKIRDSNGAERLTTQLYFQGDPHIECDEFANESLVMPTTGTFNTQLQASNIDFILS